MADALTPQKLVLHNSGCVYAGLLLQAENVPVLSRSSCLYHLYNRQMQVRKEIKGIRETLKAARALPILQSKH